MNSSKTILIDVPCPISMRNVVTGSNSVAVRLQRMGYHVVLMVPYYAESEMRHSFSGFDIEPISLPSLVSKRTQFSDFITKHLNLTRMQVLGSKYGLRSNLDPKTRRAYLHFFRSLIAHTLGKWQWFRLVAAPQLHLWAYRSRPMKDLFDRVKPDLVFIPNTGAPQSEESLRECTRRDTPMIGMVGSWDHPHKRFLVIKPKEMFVWSDSLKEEMVTLQSHAPESILVVGAPHFDLFMDPSMVMSREEFFAKMKLDSERKLITIFSGAGRAPDENDVVDMLLSWDRERKTVESVAIHIRSYPGDPLEHLKFDCFEGEQNVYTEWFLKSKEFGPIPVNYFPDFEYMRDVISLYYHSEAILSVYSSASVEASIFLKPAINISFDGYKQRPYKESVRRFVLQSHFDKLFSTGAVLEAGSPAELLSVMNTVLSNPAYNRDKIEKLQEIVCGPVDGKTSERIARHLARTLEETKT